MSKHGTLRLLQGTWMGFLAWSCIALHLVPTRLQAEDPPLLPDLAVAGALSAPTPPAGKATLVVQNRLLCMVLGRAITVLDVQKQMEAQFYANFPEYRDQPQMKWEFFQVRWRAALDELINQQLVLADAEDRKIEISDGDVREELIHRFGQDLIAAMDAMNMDLPEAWEMVRNDLIVQKMLGSKVYFPAFASVSAEQVRHAYEVACRQAEAQQQWKYRVVTIRGQDGAATQEVAHTVYTRLQKEPDVAPTHLEHLIAECTLPEGCTCTVSEEFCQPVQQISPQYRDTLAQLETGTFSAPLQQHSRATGGSVHRILCCLDKETGQYQSFQEEASKLQEQLVGAAIEAGMKRYYQELRERFGIRSSDLQKWMPPELMPFQVRS